MKNEESLFDHLEKADMIDTFIMFLVNLTMPEDDIKEIEEMKLIRDEIQKSFDRPNEIPVEKVTRFNELVRKHFPPEVDEV